MNLSSNKRLIRSVLVLVIVVAVLGIAWQTIFSRPFVKVVIPKEADSVTLVRQSETKDRHTANSTTRLRLAVGSYQATYYKAGQAVGITNLSVKPSPWQTLEATLSAPTHALHAFMRQHADLVTPLGKGYLYLNTQTRGLEYADEKDTLQLSEQFELEAGQTDPSEVSYNAVVAIEPLKDNGAVVTMTSGVWVVKSPTDIHKMPPSFERFLNLTSSSYDSSSNHVYALSTYDKRVYSYDLNKPESPPKMLFEGKKEINRVVAGGGKIITYFDDIPSLEPSVIAAYSNLRQLEPIVYDASGKELKRLDNYTATTQARIAGDGSFVALKKKFATDMDIVGLDNNKTYTVPAPDLRGLTWQDDTLYFGREKSLWSFNPKTSDSQDVVLAALADNYIGSVVATADTVIAATTDDFFAKLAPKDSSGNQQVSGLKKLRLTGDGYYTGFVSSGSGIKITVETKGSFTRGLEAADQAAELAAAQTKQYQAALGELKEYANNPGVNVSQRDSSIILLYTYTGPGRDDESE